MDEITASMRDKFADESLAKAILEVSGWFGKGPVPVTLLVAAVKRLR